MVDESSILIIDDNPEMLNLFTDMLIKEGFKKAMGVTSGINIKDVIRDKNPGITLLDISIPGEDSLDILRAIKKVSPLLPVIMLGERKDAGLGKKALRLGASSYITRSGSVSDTVRDVKMESDRCLALKAEKKLYILVIDDDKEITDMVENFLKANGYGCSVIHDGRKAASILKSQKPNLVLLDIVMPAIDGIELLHQIKGIDKDIKVIMLSGVTDEEICIEAVKKGASGYITKPFSLQQLRTTILTILLEE